MPVTPETLQDALRRYQRGYQFKTGDLVQWKPGLKDRKLPLDTEPAIVVQVLDEPVFDSTVGAGSPYFNVPYDLVLGVVDADGDFLTFHFTSARFEPYQAR